jgi:hypothetical protein
MSSRDAVLAYLASFRSNKLSGCKHNVNPTTCCSESRTGICVMNLGNASVRPEESAPLVSRAPIRRARMKGSIAFVFASCLKVALLIL